MQKEQKKKKKKGKEINKYLTIEFALPYAALKPKTGCESE
jgi:hypothetical protein